MSTPMSTPTGTLISTRLRDYRMLWRAAVTNTDPRMSAITRWGTSTLVLLVGAAMAYVEGPRAALAWFWCAASGFLLLTWAWRFLPGAVKLAAPANAKLVPHLRRRLIELSWLVCCTGIAGIASAPFTGTSGLGAWLFWIVVFMAGTGLGVAGHRAGSAIVMTATFSTLFVSQVPAALTDLLSHPLAVLLSLPIYAVIIYLAVCAMFPQAGERHWAMLARRARWVTAAGKADPLVEQLAGKEARGWYAASLRRDSARRDGRRLMLHALGPAHHLGEVMVLQGFMTAVVLALVFVTAWRHDFRLMSDFGWLFACMLLLVPLVYCVRLGQLPSSLAAEQALVRLAPAMPASATAFNLMLGRSLLLKTLSVWGLAAGAALLLAALGGAGAQALLRLASLSCMVLPAVATPLRDHASRGESAAAAAVTLLLVPTVEGLILGAAVNAFTRLPILPLAALFSIGYTVYAVVRGLRTMRRSPCAFPAGRID